MAVKNKKRGNWESEVSIPMDLRVNERDTTTTNIELERALVEHPDGDGVNVLFFSVPGVEDDMLVRSIRVFVLPQPLSNLPADHDLPDMEDLYHTNIPWSGCVTFKNSERFKGQALAAFVEVIREFDGFLYELSTKEPGKDTSLRVVDIQAPALNRLYWTIRQKPANQSAILRKKFATAQKTPPQLLAAMKMHGIEPNHAGAFALKHGYVTLYHRLYGMVMPRKDTLCSKSSVSG